jgi:ferredoxin
MAKKIMLCSCADSQSVDPQKVMASQVSCSTCFSELCGRNVDAVAKALQGDDDIIIGCTQEIALFDDLAAQLDVAPAGYVDLRDRAGWSDQGADAGPKMAALVAEAVLPVAFGQAMDVTSEGVCLIVGPANVALPLAEKLAEDLAITVLLTDDGEPVLDGDPALYDRRYDVVRGQLRLVTGALGGFSVSIDGLRQLQTSGRGAFAFGPARDGGQSQCDILIDVAGTSAFVTEPAKRDGYLRADPKSGVAVANLAFAAVQLVGTFEKTLHVSLDDALCAHSRAGQVGCSNCLDICPTGAISPAGDFVSIDPAICAGCGACAALCPSTAITYDDPPVGYLVKRLKVLADTYRQAGGVAPRVLVHDAHGGDMIRLAARFGRGLPADVIPLEVTTVSAIGHAELLAGLGVGFASVSVLLAPTTERDALVREIALAEAIVAGGVKAADQTATESQTVVGTSGASAKIALLDISDPDVLSDVLYDAAAPLPVAEPILPLGNRRQIARLSAQALHPDAVAPLELPDGAPYGATVVDRDACTLCLSCVSLCPSGALIDNPDMPQLRFQEDACLQCGLCVTICPEDAITLQPQLDLSDHALTQRIHNEEEPFACVECNALFGVRSTVERIMEKLAGTHPMFASSDQARMIQMCDDCRVATQFKATDNPFAGAEKPKVRTSEDYYSARKDH